MEEDEESYTSSSESESEEEDSDTEESTATKLVQDDTNFLKIPTDADVPKRTISPDYPLRSISPMTMDVSSDQLTILQSMYSMNNSKLLRPVEDDSMFAEKPHDDSRARLFD